jgi:protein associated with RNAse G/E
MIPTLKTEPKITWYISEVTPAVTRKAVNLQKSIRAACTIEPDEVAMMVNFTYYLAATRAMDYPPNARQSVRSLADFLSTWEDCAPAEVWQFYLDNIPHKLRNIWDEAFDEAQNLFETDTAELPDIALTDNQKAEAALPGSPLTSNGATSL